MFMGKCIWKYNWSLIIFFNAKHIENAIFFIMIISYMSTFKKFCIPKLYIAGGPSRFIKEINVLISNCKYVILSKAELSNPLLNI